MCKIFTGYHGTGEIEYGLCACTVDNKARGLSLLTGAQTMLYLSLSDKSYCFSQLSISVKNRRPGPNQNEPTTSSNLGV